MSLRLEFDVSHGDWFALRNEHWVQLCTSGPTGFQRYARLFHDPAGIDADQEELQNFEDQPPRELLAPLLDVLARHTTTPDDVLVAIWDGYGVMPDRLRSVPTVDLRRRKYLLLRGSLHDVSRWVAGTDRDAPDYTDHPNLMWPGDRAWFVASEIDMPWTSIGGSQDLINEVLVGPGLDAAPFAPSDRPPYWRN